MMPIFNGFAGWLNPIEELNINGIVPSPAADMVNLLRNLRRVEVLLFFMASSPICAALLTVERKQYLIIVKAIGVVIILYHKVCLTHAQDAILIIMLCCKEIK